ncbi:response regulator transcription factor (plasmid) [Microvirga terrae]|uniref:Response regulator transcription factor n=1 Tax=Microvirga terrae TaxID=2740529 RepID=A0ABY5S285_9HYPH|nr:response regulator transcription factor [Microvirga terrae]UVF22641.1 response regulator transcription factor [Microvirga terrae]
MREEQPIVFVVDDDPKVRNSLENLLGSVGLEVRLFGSTLEFLNNPRPDVPACLVLDVRLPGLSGLDLQRELNRLSIDLPIIFVSGHADVPMTVRAMKAGAVEFLTKPYREQDLLDAIQVGIERDRARRQELRSLSGLQQRFAALTPREREVMDLVVSGLMNKQIAAKLQVSEITVKVHRAHVMRKMQARSLADLVRIAERLHTGLGQAPLA